MAKLGKKYQEVAKLVDSSKKYSLVEAVELAKELYDETLAMLKEHKEFHQAIVDVLLEKETISGDELDALYRKFVTREVDTEEIPELSSEVEETTEDIQTAEE
jgi:ATP-dependent Zn protease